MPELFAILRSVATSIFDRHCTDALVTRPPPPVVVVVVVVVAVLLRPCLRQPVAFTMVSSVASVVDHGCADHVLYAPLFNEAALYNPHVLSITVTAPTTPAPADCPASITLVGSPPNCRTLSRTLGKARRGVNQKCANTQQHYALQKSFINASKRL